MRHPSAVRHRGHTANVRGSRFRSCLRDIKVFAEALRDSQIMWMAKLKNPSEANELFEKLSVQYPNHLPLIQAQLKRLCDTKVILQNFAVTFEKTTESRVS